MEWLDAGKREGGESKTHDVEPTNDIPAELRKTPGGAAYHRPGTSVCRSCCKTGVRGSECTTTASSMRVRRSQAIAAILRAEAGEGNGNAERYLQVAALPDKARDKSEEERQTQIAKGRAEAIVGVLSIGALAPSAPSGRMHEQGKAAQEASARRLEAEEQEAASTAKAVGELVTTTTGRHTEKGRKTQ